MPQYDPTADLEPDDSLPVDDGPMSVEEMGQIDISDPKAQAAMQAAYKPDERIGRTLMMRIDGLSQQEVMALDQAITPQNGPVFLKLFPELAPLIMLASSLAGMQGGQGAPAPMPAPQPRPMGGAMPPNGFRGVPMR